MTSHPARHEQRRICAFLRANCEHSLTFLHLPLQVRKRVYSEIGLPTEKRICLNRCLEHDGRQLFQSDCQTILSLLKTCHAIYTEVSQILYAENGFVAHQEKRGSLGSLLSLRPSTLQHLTRLKIHADIATDRSTSLCCFAPWNRRCCRRHGTNARQCSAKSKLADFQAALSHVLQYMAAFNLRLGIVCNAQIVDEINEILAPLYSTDVLLECALNVSPSPDLTLSAFAKDIATRSTGQVQHKPTFRFFDLPSELQYHVLEFTELVTDTRQIIWSPGTGHSTYVSQVRYNKSFDMAIDNWRDRQYSPSFDKAFDELWESSFDESHQFWKMRDHEPWFRDSRSDFCHLRHAVYAQHCQCRLPPTSLFLVCRRLWQLASEVFFKRNRIIIRPTQGFTTTLEETPPVLEVSTYLRTIIPKDALRHLRFLEIVFPPFERAYLRFSDSAYADWLELIQFMKDHLNLPLLTLRIYFADHEEYDMAYDYGVFPVRSKIDSAGIKAILDTYDRTIHPLSLLHEHGLQRFFLHLASPWRWLSRNRRLELDVVKRKMTPFEQNRERYVMGQDYDSASMGKYDVGESRWYTAATTITDY